MRSVLITGEPALWSAGADERSVTREREWKQRIRDAVGVSVCAPQGILLHFMVKEWSRRGHHFDLDNLVTPVFRAIYGDGNRDRIEARSALCSWRAVIGQATTPFLLLDFLAHPLHDVQDLSGAQLVIDHTWVGPLPTNSREGDAGLALWVRQQIGSYSPSDTDRFALQLIFGDGLRALTRPEEKPIKPVIDCLYPIFWGTPARGDDWKKLALQVERRPDLQGTCHLRCWRLPVDV